MSGEYGLSTSCEKSNLFLDICANFIQCFYFDMCKLLRPGAFIYIYENFVPNVDHSVETFKIINKPYLEHCSEMFNK